MTAPVDPRPYAAPPREYPPCHQNTQERGVADTLDAAKLAAEDSMLAHARLVVETLRPRLADHEREWSE